MDYDGMQKTVTLNKAVKKYGNSGGVYLPASWIGGEVEVRLVRKPANPEADILSALSGSMQHVVSVILYGSHARGEQAEGSDVDVLVVTDGSLKGELKLSENLKGSRYDVTVMDRAQVEKALAKDALFRKSLQCARALFNASFLEEIKPEGSDEASFKERIELAKSSLGIVRSILDAQGPDENLVYPLVMRIKEMLLIRCASGNVEYSSRMLKDAVTGRGITDGDFSIIMEQYRAARDGKPPAKGKLGGNVFEKLVDLLSELIEDAEKKQKAGKGY